MRDPFNTAVAGALNDVYLSKGSPLSAMVEAVGVSKNTILRYLAGERDIRVATLEKMAAALETPVAEIVTKAVVRVEQSDQGNA